MLIKSDDFEKIMKGLTNAVAKNNCNEALEYIEIACNGTNLKATATNGYIAVRYECEIEEPCYDTFLLKPIKTNPKYVGYVALENDNGKTIVKYDNSTFMFNSSLNLPNLEAIVSKAKLNDKAQVTLSKKELLNLLKGCGEYVSFYIGDSLQPVYVETNDNQTTGVICPVRKN